MVKGHALCSRGLELESQTRRLVHQCNFSQTFGDNCWRYRVRAMSHALGRGEPGGGGGGFSVKSNPVYIRKSEVQ